MRVLPPDEEVRMSIDQPTMQLVRKLQTRAVLDRADIVAILELPCSLRTYEAPGYLIREGATSLQQCSFIRSGFAFRQKLTVDGNRQIVGITLPGDFVDLQHLFLNRADHSVQVLTRVETMDLDRGALQQLAQKRPNVNKALWIDSLIEASIHREWVLNVGRRDARQRIAHLLCEFTLRMKQAGLEQGSNYELPMTQEQLGDAVGLTSVHVNRTLKALAKDGLVQREKRYLTIADWDKVRTIGDFSALYLHFDQGGPEGV